MTHRLLAAALVVPWLIGCSGFKWPMGGANAARPAGLAPGDDPRAADAKDAPPPKIDPSTRVSAGRMLESDGNVPGAIEQYHKAVREDPRNVAAWSHLGMAHIRAGQFNEAEAALVKALELAPQRPAAHNNLGFCYMLQGRREPAERSFREALSIKPDFSRARMNLATVLVQSGRQDEALAEFSQVVSKDAAYFNVGLLLVGEKDAAGAEKAFRAALQLNPQNAPAAAQLARLIRRRSDGPAIAGATEVSPPAALAAPPQAVADTGRP